MPGAGALGVCAIYEEFAWTNDVAVLQIVEERRLLVQVSELGRAGDSWLEVDDGPLNWITPVDVLRCLRSRPYQGHFAAQHIEQLRKLVELGATKESPDSGDPRIVAECYPRPIYRTHRPELENPEGAPTLPNTRRREEDWSHVTGQSIGKGNPRGQDADHHHPRQRHHHVNAPLECANSVAVGSTLHQRPQVKGKSCGLPSSATQPHSILRLWVQKSISASLNRHRGVHGVAGGLMRGYAPSRRPGATAELVESRGEGQRLRAGQGTHEVVGSVDVGYALRVLLPRIWILIASGTVAGAAALLASGLLPTTFESDATLIVGQSSGAPPTVYEDLLAAQILANTYAALSTTTPVLSAARERAGVSISIEELRDHVRVEAIRNSLLVVVTAEFPTAEEAARVANAIAEGTAAIGADDNDSLQISVVDPARPAEEPISPRPLTNAAVATAIGVLASGTLILLAFGTSRPPPRHGATSDGPERRSAYREGR